MTEDKKKIRRTIRRRRRALSEKQLLQAEQGIAKSAHHCRALWSCSQVLSYLPFEGEISPATIESNLKTNTTIYLPRILNYRTHRMQFYSAKHVERQNRYGITEPKRTSPPIQANRVRAVLLPLVAFDRSGNRIGMGAGYYDRALRSLVHQGSTRPFLIGLAHSFQELVTIEAQDWDVPLDAILTDREYIPVSSSLKTQYI